MAGRAAERQKAMATLVLVNRPNPDRHYPLASDPVVIGRSPDCGVILASPAVSREHARIYCIGRQHFVQDLNSQNKTYVNNEEVRPENPLPLRHYDRLRICDCWFIFYDEAPPPFSPTTDDAEDKPSTIISVVDSDAPNSKRILDAQPAVKLKILLELSNQLTRTLDPESLLPQVIENLFRVFPLAEYGFFIERDRSRNLYRKTARSRRPGDPLQANFSRSIVHQCIDTGQALLIEDTQAAPNVVPVTESITANRIRSAISAPVVGNDGTTFGVIQLYTQNQDKRFAHEDLELLVAVSNQAALAIDNARLHKKRVAMERHMYDLKMAAEVQLSFLPRRSPAVAGYDFFAHYQPARSVGGDLYSFVPLPDRKLVVAIGDVAGKGMPAALLMARVTNEIRHAVAEESDPAAVVTILNEMLCGTLTEQFVTFLLTVLDPEEATLSIVNAGHLALLVRHSSGELIEVGEDNDLGLPLGVRSDAQYSTCVVPLEPGDCAVLCTDGIIEAVNPAGEMFGKARLCAAIAGSPPTPRQVGARLLEAVSHHAAGVQEQHDDITLVCVGRLP